METSELLAERGKTHGDYSDDARCAMRLVDVIDGELLNRLDRGQPALTVVQRHSLYMIAFKMARIVTGTAGFKDHWDDIAGYAKLVADRCWMQGDPVDDFIAKAIRNAPPFECPDVGQEPPEQYRPGSPTSSWQPKVEERRQHTRRVYQLPGREVPNRRHHSRGRRTTDVPWSGNRGYYY